MGRFVVPFGIATLVLASCALATDYDSYQGQNQVAPRGDDDDDHAKTDASATKQDSGAKPAPDAGTEVTPPGPRFVQSAVGHLVTAKDVPAVLGQASTAGDLIVVAIGVEEADTASVQKVDDNAGNVYVSAGHKSVDGNCNDAAEIWFAKNVNAGATQVTVHVSAAVEVETWVIEVAGMSRTDPLAAGNQTSGAKTTVVHAPTVETTGANNFVVSTTTVCEDVTALQPTTPAFTNLELLNGEATAWLLAKDPGTYGAVWISDNGTFNASTVAFKP